VEAVVVVGGCEGRPGGRGEGRGRAQRLQDLLRSRRPAAPRHGARSRDRALRRPRVQGAVGGLGLGEGGGAARGAPELGFRRRRRRREVGGWGGKGGIGGE
jgi:hypothetical protein